MATLESSLPAAARALRRRFACDHVSILAVPDGSGPLLALDSALGEEDDLRSLLATPDPERVERIQAERESLVADIASLAQTPVDTALLKRGGRSAMRLPLRDECDEPLGTVEVVSREAASFSADHLVELRELTAIVEGFVRRASLKRRVNRQQERLATSAEILATLSSTTNLVSAGDAICLALRRFFAAEHTALGTIDLDDNVREVFGFSSTLLERSVLPTKLPDEDVAAYAEAIAGVPQRFADLSCLRLNPGTAVACEAGLRSLIRAPFKLSDGRAGLVTVASSAVDYFRDDDAQDLLELCQPIGLAVDRVALIEEMAQATALLEAQANVLGALAPGATMETVGQAFVDEARRLFRADHAVVVAVEDGRTRAVAVSSNFVSEPRSDVPRPRDPAGASRFDALLHGQPQLIADLAVRRESKLDEWLYQAGMRCLMRVPIRRSDSTVTGMVGVGSARPHAYDEFELGRLLELSSVVGIVAERAELLAAADDRARKVRSLTRMLETLNVNAAPEEVARLFASEVQRFIGADSVVVHAFDHDSGMRVEVATVSDQKLDILPRNPLANSRSYQGMLQYSAIALDHRHPDATPRWFRDLAAELGLGSAIAVRLDGRDLPVGFVIAACRERDRLGLPELQILREVAGPLAMLLERARTVTALQRQASRTRAILDVLAAIGPRETIEEVARPVATALRAIYEADHCLVGVVEDGLVNIAAIDSIVAAWPLGTTGHFEYVASDGDPGSVEPVAAPFTLDPAEGLQGRVSEVLYEKGLRSGMQAFAGTPGVPLCFVLIASRARNRFTEADAQELAQIIQPLGVSVSFFRGRREAERRTRRLEYTNRILSALSAGGTEAEQSATFAAQSRRMFDAAHAVVLRFDEDARATTLLAVDSDVIDTAHLPRTWALEEIAPEGVAALSTAEVIADVRAQAQLGRLQQELRSLGLFSTMHAPLVVEGKVEGCVILWGYGTAHFDDEDDHLLAALAGPFAVALEKTAALASLSESELKYRSLVGQAEEMIFLVDGETHAIVDANPYTARSLGYSPDELLSLRIEDLVSDSAEAVARNVDRALAEGSLHLIERPYRRKDGSPIDVDLVASVIRYGGRQVILVMARDVSERKALQRQLVQGQKMESLGVMAGAVAHDFNNLLTTIMGFAGILKRSSGIEGDERENLALIEDAARRAADLTGRLLAFARGGMAQFGPVDLRDVVADTLRLAEPTLQAALTLSVELPPEPVIVEGDQGQLQQALLNIILNARDAMSLGGQVAIRVTAERRQAVLSVVDDGPGMDEDTRIRIFEPFFTTKPAGSGTGLGLSIAYGIIKGHQGTVDVASAPGQGTTFTIRLPRLNAERKSASRRPGAGGQAILVVDDDDMVRRTTLATLALLGYPAVEASSGAAALEMVHHEPGSIAAVLLDLVMPGLPGAETLRQLREVCPNLPIVVCTGYAAESHLDPAALATVQGVVQKPFSPERLRSALEAAVKQLPVAN